MASKFRNAGQTCVCANRILVQDDIYDEFAARLTKKVSGLVVGDGLDEKVTIGPLINDSAVEKVLGHVDDARAHGATATVGGGAHARGGHFFAPTVLIGMTRLCCHRRILGPWHRCSASSRDGHEIATARVGLAPIYPENIRISWRFAELLEFGIVCLTRAASRETAPVGRDDLIRQGGIAHGIDESCSQVFSSRRHNVTIMPTSEELLELADRCAEKVDLEGKLRHVPSFSDAEEQCEDEYEALLEAIHEDELFAPVDILRQERLVEQIAAALPEEKRVMIVELADNHARHIWLQQEGAYHLGLAVGRRFACGANRRECSIPKLMLAWTLRLIPKPPHAAERNA